MALEPGTFNSEDHFEIGTFTEREGALETGTPDEIIQCPACRISLSEKLCSFSKTFSSFRVVVITQTKIRNEFSPPGGAVTCFSALPLFITIEIMSKQK